MTDIIQRSEQFNPSNVMFTKLKKNKNGGKTVYINAQDGKKKLYLQLPAMRCPFGVSAFTDESTNRTSYSLDLSFDTDNEQASELAEKLKELDEKIIETVANNSKEWLGKEYSIEVIKEALYKPIIRVSKEDYPSTMKLKIMTKPNGDFLPEAYNSSRELIPLDSIEKGQRCRCIVDFNQIWFIDNKFGVSVRLSQVLCEQSTKLPSFAFQGLDDDKLQDDYIEEIMDDLIDE